MRTVTKAFKIYKLDELTKEARNKAYSKWQQDFDYVYESENEATLHAFIQIFNINVDRWSYDDYSYSYYLISHYSEEEDNLKGVRLMKYLVNNYWNDLYIPKTYFGHNHKAKRNSRVFVTNDCVLTGVYIDHEILQPIYDFLKTPDDTTLYELMDRCLDNFFKACRDDMKYQVSEEAFAEFCEDNNYEFLYDGTLFE